MPDIYGNISEGRVVVQLKGQSEDFPMGIAMAFNVNQPINGTPEDYISEEGQNTIREIQADYLTTFTHIFDEAWAQHFSDKTQKSMTGIMSVITRNETIPYKGTAVPTLDLEIRPGMESGKGDAQMQLMLTDTDLNKDGTLKRAKHFRGVPSAPWTYFSGDSVDLLTTDTEISGGKALTGFNDKYKDEVGIGGQDGAPMHVGHLVYAMSHGNGGVIGIQTLRSGETEQKIPNVDIVVNGPAGLGYLLMEMAKVVNESKEQPRKTTLVSSILDFMRKHSNFFTTHIPLRR